MLPLNAGRNPHCYIVWKSVLKPTKSSYVEVHRINCNSTEYDLVSTQAEVYYRSESFAVPLLRRYRRSVLERNSNILFFLLSFVLHRIIRRILIGGRQCLNKPLGIGKHTFVTAVPFNLYRNVGNIADFLFCRFRKGLVISAYFTYISSKSAFLVVCRTAFPSLTGLSGNFPSVTGIALTAAAESSVASVSSLTVIGSSFCLRRGR